MKTTIRIFLLGLLSLVLCMCDRDKELNLENTKKVPENIDYVLDIVNGILDISKIESNKIEIVEAEYSGKKMINEILNEK